ncbi:hypothetical protein DC366_08330 [Pelagivirga sediminicola]|uniref:DUF3035 domain-containing protein n=1 Tax=Pelagivirga sediminicola TaxID=2170575 RepID=A0A2T7G788_9RHOB|nr:hypothetical protein [Pelagivirga sediminicola]PVA10246.1 hypothetical protein DC366_08330 [Pelagivirga sediminicola]
MRLTFAIALTAALCAGAMLPGCTQFPELDATIPDAARRAPYPDLVPLEGFRTRLDNSRIPQGSAESVEDRAARLRARADRLSGSVIDSATRARMQAGVQQ